MNPVKSIIIRNRGTEKVMLGKNEAEGGFSTSANQEAQSLARHHQKPKKRRGDLPSTSKATSLLISLLQPSRLWAKLISEVLAMVFLATDSGKEHRTAPENFCSSIRTVSVLILLIRGQFYLVHHLLMYYDSIGRDQLTFSLASARRAFGNKCQSC